MATKGTVSGVIANMVTLVVDGPSKNLDFAIEDNKTTETEVGVTLYEADEYIRDYYALYEIWKVKDAIVSAAALLFSFQTLCLNPARQIPPSLFR